MEIKYSDAESVKNKMTRITELETPWFKYNMMLDVFGERMKGKVKITRIENTEKGNNESGSFSYAMYAYDIPDYLQICKKIKEQKYEFMVSLDSENIEAMFYECLFLPHTYQTITYKKVVITEKMFKGER